MHMCTVCAHVCVCVCVDGCVGACVLLRQWLRHAAWHLLSVSIKAAIHVLLDQWYQALCRAQFQVFTIEKCEFTEVVREKEQ